MGEHVPESSGGITKETVTGSQQSLSGIPESLQTPDSGQARLQELGYVQELRRHYGGLGSICVGVSTMSYMLTITGLFPTALLYGGPVPILYGWLFISVLQLVIGLALAELSSSYPLAGGPYFWCVELTGNDRRYILIAWVTGWLNVLGQFAAAAGCGYLTAQHLGEMLELSSGCEITLQDTFLIYAIVLVVCGVMSSMPTRLMRNYAIFAAGWLAVGGIVVFVLLLVTAWPLQPASFVFTAFTSEQKSAMGIPNDVYLFLLGAVMAQYGYIGIESPAQFAEETRRADRTVPRGIVYSTLLNFTFGLGYIIVILFSLPADYLDPAEPFTIPGLFVRSFERRFGSGQGGQLLSAVPLIAILNTTVMTMATASRMLWSFARDGGVPMYRVWAAVNPCTWTPVNAVWAMTALAFVFGVPMLWSPQAFAALGSITNIGLYLSYAAPILLRILFRRGFKRGPFHLGRCSIAVMASACIAIVFNLACCLLPTQLPVSILNLNWAPIMGGFVIGLALAAWFFPVHGARSWYTGKSHTLRDATVRGGERYVDSSPAGGSANLAPHMPSAQSAGIPLLDLLQKEVSHADKARRAAPADCVFSREAALFTPDESGKGLRVVRKSGPVAKQIRASIDLRGMDPIQIRRQRPVDSFWRTSTIESRRSCSGSLSSIEELPEAPRSRCSPSQGASQDEP